MSQSWIAIVISLLALWVAYPGYAKKAENLFLTKSITDTCSLWHYQQYHAVSIGLCWSVTIENISEDTVILQDFTLQDLHRNENEVTADRQFGHLQDIEHTGGTPLQFPVSVKSVESLTVVIRAPFVIQAVPGLTSSVVPGDSRHDEEEFAYRYLGGGPQVRSLLDFRSQLLNIDLIGNPAYPWQEAGYWYYHVPPQLYQVTGMFATASGGHRSIVLSYPDENVAVQQKVNY